MTVSIDSRVSPALDPETYKVEGYDEDTAPFVGCIINAMYDAYVVVGKIHDARAAADRNGAWTEDQKVLIVGKEAETQKERVLKRLALAERDIRASIGHTEKLLSEPLTEKAGLGSLNGEVRAFVLGLDRPKREAFMREVLEANDEQTLTAVLGAQHFLSGLTAIDHDRYLRLYHEKKQPQLVRRLDVMKRVLGKFERNIQNVHSQFDKAVGASPSVVNRLSKANEQALAALKIVPTA